MSQTATRRELLTLLLGPRPERSPVPPPQALPEYLRPPGALPEGELNAVCERCGDCAGACPHDAILPLGPAYGEAEGTPALLPRDRPCQLCADLPCAAACPSGALRVVPIEQVRLGTARLEPSRCWLVQGQPCDYCFGECPLGERALRLEGGRPEVITDECTGCGRCVHICTATPPALRIEPAHA